MPRDEWKRANDRAKYGPVPHEKRERKPRKQRKQRKQREAPADKWVYIIHIKTPAIAIKPDGTEKHINTTKTLRFGKQATGHRRPGFHTFQRRGFYLIVDNIYVGKDTISKRRRGTDKADKTARRRT